MKLEQLINQVKSNDFDWIEKDIQGIMITLYDMEREGDKISISTTDETDDCIRNNIDVNPDTIMFEISEWLCDLLAGCSDVQLVITDEYNQSDKRFHYRVEL